MSVAAWTISVLKFHLICLFVTTACGDGCVSCDSGTVCNNCTAKYTMVDGETTGSRVCARKYSFLLELSVTRLAFVTRIENSRDKVVLLMK